MTLEELEEELAKILESKELARALLGELGTGVQRLKIRTDPFGALEQALAALMNRLRSIYEQRLGTLRNNEILLNFVSSLAMPSPSAGAKLGPVGDRASVMKR